MKAVLYFVVFLTFLTLLTSNVALAANPPIKLTPADNKAKQVIIGNESAAVDHNWDRFDFIQGSVKGDDGNFTIYDLRGVNDTAPPIVCGEGTHEENGVCVPDVVVPPVDNGTQPPECPAGTHEDNGTCVPDVVVPPIDNGTQPPVVNETGGETTIAASGDFSGSSGTAVISKMKADINVALGDLFYQATLDPFIKVFPKDDSHKCVPGNHDQEEDGNSNIAKQSSEYCGDIWIDKVAGGTTVLIGANTNGNLDVLLGTAQQYVMDPALMDGVKNVVLFTHKPCHINDNAHHPVEGNVKTFCQSLEGKTPAGVNFVTISGHEHNAQKNDNDKWFIAGIGGKTKYDCGSTSGGWSFCNDTDNGYLQLTIDNDSGDITSKFIKTNGGVMS